MPKSELESAVTMLDGDWRCKNPLPWFDSSADKLQRGHVTVIGGSPQTPGSILVSGTAALRVGAGRLNFITVPEVAAELALARPESRVYPYLSRGGLRRLGAVCTRAQALVVGPGALSGWLMKAVLERVLPLSCPLVLDALALRLVHPQKLSSHGGACVLTPHQRELEQLLDGNGDAASLARQTGCIVVAKGPQTIIAAPDGRRLLNTSGHVGLATSGSGDVLSGAIGGLLARGLPALEAAAWGVLLHALAAEALGPPGFLAGELSAEFPKLMAREVRQ